MVCKFGDWTVDVGVDWGEGVRGLSENRLDLWCGILEAHIAIFFHRQIKPWSLLTLFFVFGLGSHIRPSNSS